jgi:hypothetical protein
MQVVYHLGAPCTDDDLLVKSLMKSGAALAQSGISVPPPARYRTLLREASRSLNGRATTPQMQEALLDAIVDEAEVNRLVLSDPRFISINRLVVQGAQIWPMIERQSDALRAFWPEAQAEFAIGIRNPATLIPALFRTSRFSDFEEFAKNMQPAAVAWSETIHRLRNAQPDCPIVVWCNEDTPLLWGEILRDLAGVSSDAQLAGQDDLIKTLMQPAGYDRMARYLAETPPASDQQRRRVMAAFLERYAKEEVLEETVDLPGWSDDLVSRMTEAYDADIEAICQIRDVTVLLP